MFAVVLARPSHMGCPCSKKHVGVLWNQQIQCFQKRFWNVFTQSKNVGHELKIHRTALPDDEVAALKHCRCSQQSIIPSLLWNICTSTVHICLYVEFYIWPLASQGYCLRGGHANRYYECWCQLCGRYRSSYFSVRESLQYCCLHQNHAFSFQNLCSFVFILTTLFTAFLFTESLIYLKDCFYQNIYEGHCLWQSR